LWSDPGQAGVFGKQGLCGYLDLAELDGSNSFVIDGLTSLTYQALPSAQQGISMAMASMTC